MRRVARGVEDADVRRAYADTERLQGALVRLVGGLARDREALEPALRDAARGETAEQREHDPDCDDRPAMTGDDVSEAGEQPGFLPPARVPACGLSGFHADSSVGWRS